MNQQRDFGVPADAALLPGCGTKPGKAFKMDVVVPVKCCSVEPWTQRLSTCCTDRLTE